MKRDLPIHDPLLAQALAAESALAQAHEARRQGELALALAHALTAHARSPVPGMRVTAGMLACFCQFRLGAGQYPALLALGEPLLAQVAEPGRRLALLRWLTVAAAETGQPALALRLGAEAQALAEAGGDEAALTQVRQAVALSFDRLGDPWRAERLLCETLPHAESLPVLFPLLSTLQQLAESTLDAFHLGQGQAGAGPAGAQHAGTQHPGDHPLRPIGPPVATPEADPALARAQAYAARARAAAQRVGDAHFRAFLDGLLGEVLLYQGAADEAWPLLERALCEAQAHGHGTLAARMDCALAEGLLRRREPQQALARLAHLLADGGAPLPPTLQQRAHRAMAQACQSLGQRDRASMHAAQAERLRSQQADWRTRFSGATPA